LVARRRRRRRRSTIIMAGNNKSGRNRPASAPATVVVADRLLRTALSSLVVIYLVITFLCYTKVENTAVTTVSPIDITTDVSDTTTSSLRSLLFSSPQQQKPQRKTKTPADLQQMFPIRIDVHDASQMEEIIHPGYQLLEEDVKSSWTLPNTTISVPKFFDDLYGAYYNDSITIRHYLGNYDEAKSGTNSGMTLDQAKSIGSIDTNTGHETIYASIASYRDPECSETVADLFLRAKYPERIRLAILDQIVKDVDEPCAIPSQYINQVDRYELDARYAVGPVFARHLAHRYYRGEYYAMQIDSHVRFTHHWDEDIIGQWQSAHNEMAVLSTYLSDLIGSIDPVSHTSIHNSRPIMCVSDYEGSGATKHLRHGQQPEGPPGIRGQPTLHPFWAAGFSFARGHFVLQVPYDQYLPMVFQGEEISIGLRGFTYGYDYYAAERSVCFHMYAVQENEAKRKAIPLFWENAKLYRGVGVKAMKRLNTIIGMADFPTNEWPNDDAQKYGLGHVRRPSQFFDTFGIHVQNQTVEQHLCRFVGKPMMDAFLPKLRSNTMGIDYDLITYRFQDPVGQLVNHNKPPPQPKP
jgi:[Skp1-protein]-hydroxyproline N-acetylglucosaminyltransferase